MATTSGNLTATGSVTLTKPATDTLTFLQISGTYGTVQFVVEGSLDDTNFFAIAAIRYDTGGVVNGTISPSDNAEQCWKVPSEGLTKVRARVTAIASGTATFTLNSAAYVGVAFESVQQTVSASLGASTFTGDVTLSGGSNLVLSGSTGECEVHVTDNLADALSVKIAGGADFLVFDSTDSAEKLVLKNNLEVNGAVDVSFVGTTGQSEIVLTDNLADALSVKWADGDFLVFATTNGSAGITVGQHVTIADATNIVLNTTTGTKIGTATGQKLGFFNATPVAQQSTTGTTTGFTAGAGTAAKDDSTFTGNVGSAAYTVGDVVRALKNLGLLAS